MKWFGRKSAREAARPPLSRAGTLAECESGLREAAASIMAWLERHPETAGSRFVSAKCVESDEEPTRPRRQSAPSGS